MTTAARKKQDKRKRRTRILCFVMAGLLILSSVAAIFGVFG